VESEARLIRRFLPILAVVALFLVASCNHTTATPSQTRLAMGPAGKIVLFDGKDLSQWQSAKGGGEATWTITPDGALEVTPKAGDIVTKDKFQDCQLHVEFRTPIPAEGDAGQHRGNSGIFLQGRYEIQVLESYHLPPSKGDCGAVYSLIAPTQNVARPPMDWQSYDMTYRAPRYDASGKKTENARFTLIWNGVKVHDNVEIPSPTRNHTAPEPPGPGPIVLQDRGFKVQYRNIWIVPAPSNSSPTTKE
jgi:hypothetical protein